MFKMLLLQQWYGLFDPKIELEIYDRASFIDFLDLSTDSQVPDYSTISRFSSFLVENNLADKLFFEVNSQLEKKR